MAWFSPPVDRLVLAILTLLYGRCFTRGPSPPNRQHQVFKEPETIIPERRPRFKGVVNFQHNSTPYIPTPKGGGFTAKFGKKTNDPTQG